MATTITPTIVNVSASVTTAPTPSQLQQSGALVSVNGTTLTAGTYQYYGTLAALVAALATSGSGNQVELLNMATTFFAQGNFVGVYVLELGAQSSAIVGINALQTWINANPNVFYAYLVPAIWDTNDEYVSAVTITNGGTGYSSAPAVTFSAPPAGGTTATGTAVLTATAVTSVLITNAGSGYVTAPTVTFAAPGAGTTATGTASLASDLQVVASSFGSSTGKTYFFVTTTQANVANYAGTKAIFAVVPSPTAAGTEFQAAVLFYQWLAQTPSASNPAAPMDFRYVYGVTPWALVNNQTAINAILTAYGNIILTGAEGGISTALIRNGTTMDGNQAMFWYAVDWVLINAKQQLAAAVINGSNSNPPLYYSQKGINYLLAVLQRLGNTGVSFGLIQAATFTATAFAAYIAANPSSYAAGIYNGFSATVTPQTGFESVTFALNATQFAV